MNWAPRSLQKQDIKISVFQNCPNISEMASDAPIMTGNELAKTDKKWVETAQSCKQLNQRDAFLQHK